MTNLSKLSASRKKVLKEIKKFGLVQVHRVSSIHGKRRKMLMDMESQGLVVLVTPIIGSYITFSEPQAMYAKANEE